jgi:chemotaxis protein CheX
MVSTHAQLIAKLVEATSEVFETMVFCSLTPGEVMEGDIPLPPLPSSVVGAVKVVGTVGFAGSQSGVVAFHSGLPAARQITGAMLGMSADEVNGEVPDAIGEITNMIAGSFRTKMAQDGDVWAISVPTVTVGSDFRIRPVSCRHRALLPFRMGDADVYVELILGGG